jgi:hypothetical protein
LPSVLNRHWSEPQELRLFITEVVGQRGNDVGFDVLVEPEGQVGLDLENALI